MNDVSEWVQYNPVYFEFFTGINIGARLFSKLVQLNKYETNSLSDEEDELKVTNGAGAIGIHSADRNI